MTKLQELAELGQAVWLDYIRRDLLTSGGLMDLVDRGVRGVTSNPSIFEKAIAGSADYDRALAELASRDLEAMEIYEALAIEDIQRAADVLRRVYDDTDGADGYVSLEVNPTLAHETDATIAEARRLFAAVDRPNLLIKVPATPAGIPAVETLIAEGINVNITLMFSLAHYDAVAEAYIAGLERRAAEGEDLSGVASVASFFVSRVDTLVDRHLDELAAQGMGQAEALKGKIAVANAKMAYDRFCQTFYGARWQRLADLGARVQRPLWASTSTKNPDYSDTLYVDTLIGPNTVNTIPPDTLETFEAQGSVALTLEQDLEAARQQLARLAELGIDLDAVAETLQEEGVAAFARSFESLLDAVEEKVERLRAGQVEADLGPYQPAVDAALEDLAEARIVERIEAHDYTVWKPEPTEIANRLGWLHSPEVMEEQVARLEAFATAIQEAGYTDVLVLGMGGSSLAPDVFAHVFGGQGAGLDLAVLDSTDPGAVLAQAERLDLARTLFIVATKSGSTVETLSFFKYFYNRVVEAVGAEEAGAHFVAITDPGSKLETLAEDHGFRDVFLNDPNIGGRYSALSYFGLVPAALVGVDVARLLDRALALGRRPGAAARLGAILGALDGEGVDKLTFVTSPGLANFADWIEQLVAESTGKEGKGIVPVVGEPLGPPGVYGDDRLFVYLRLAGDEGVNADLDAALQVLAEAGQPVLRLALHDLYDMGAQFFLWEMATAIAGHLLGINPFDQPNVEAAKVRARRAVEAYAAEGALPGDEAASTGSGALKIFLAGAQAGDYVALQAYLQPTPETDAALRVLRVLLRDQLKLATTVGYGPRFLHSTGQLHKGDAGNGLFIQLT
ncbi:MAG: bifunctional transaldolase/phosoglucose isomerase, partial [Anaerolineae bacterium]